MATEPHFFLEQFLVWPTAIHWLSFSILYLMGFNNPPYLMAIMRKANLQYRLIRLSHPKRCRYSLDTVYRDNQKSNHDTMLERLSSFTHPVDMCQ